MDTLDHNRRAWNRQAQDGNVWTIPVADEVITEARADRWQLVLTPTLPVPRDWFGTLRGQRVLCLASGGGQQVPVLAAAGAEVLSFDLSDEQLARDRQLAERHGLPVTCMQGDMADLSRLASDSFDLIFHPASNAFVPDVAVVWRECHRVLRAGGALLAGFMNPLVFLFDEDDDDAAPDQPLIVKHRLPYSDVADLPPQALAKKLAATQPLAYSHSLDTQIGGQIAAGFSIVGFYEDRWFDDSWPLSRYSPIAMATRALKAPR
ncbi:class I SAM-dependent methyltransferase [Aquabacterium sp.]|uniref:class I SAM-dependent methyltransferase n=1 Tax=Aquabacterium sp. TaxID=1872578 RepID=UPI002C3CEF73|nr:class I SAM-dependent methyltransferase [Aquabacterium sp.]HSW04041.1 class I SAM-dependent methyltransferase [Aquabacterium sp.]